MQEVGGVAESRVREMVDRFRHQLESSGTVCAESGEIAWPGGRLSIHTDFGPAEQDKDMNQDSVVAWVPNEPSRIQCAITVADGVSSSFQAEIGAQVACWAALAELVGEVADFDNMCRRSIDAAGNAIGGLADELIEDAERFRPASEFASTWKYTLREGLLLQTTLMLAWVEGDRLNVVIVGDGGAALFAGDPSNSRATLLGGASPETNRVHALGPLNRRVSAFDYCGRVEFDGAGVIALFTDGIGRGVGSNPSELFHECVSGRQGARELIEWLVKERPSEFEDNLTLALIGRD